MTKVIVDASISLDGFVAGPSVSVEHPMGVGVERLHEWLFGAGDERDAEIAREMRETTGAVVLGRRTFDVGIGEWEDTPYAAPCFVLTHRLEDERVEKSGSFMFVPDVESAHRQAKDAAGEKDVRLMGAQVCRQFIAAGLVDEIRLQLVPVLLGDGLRLFGDTQRIELERVELIESPAVTHLRLRVTNASRDGGERVSKRP